MGTTNKVAFITGISGQDGSYLSELLLKKGYEVHGLVRRHSVAKGQDSRLAHLSDKIITHYGDLLDPSSIKEALHLVKPTEIYNLAAQSQVWVSSKVPVYTTQVNAIGVLNLLEEVRHIVPDARFYQASSSEMFGSSVDEDGYQRETTNMQPVSPYGCAKLFGYHIVRHYRRAYNMFASSGVLYNHESSKRGETFVTQKIVQGALRIKHGLQEKLALGNLYAFRDWSHATDMVRGMWMILQHNEPDDFVLASGETHSIEEFCDIVFTKLGMNYKDYVEIDPKFYRPQELEYLKGDYFKALTVLGWQPEMSFDDLIKEMIDGNMNVMFPKSCCKELVK